MDFEAKMSIFILTSRKRSLGPGNVFTHVCLFTGVVCIGGLGSANGGGGLHTVPSGTRKADVAHPTGMLSYIYIYSFSFCTRNKWMSNFKSRS